MTDEKPPVPPPLKPGDPGYEPALDRVERLMGRVMYFDRDVKPITLRQFAELTGDRGDPGAYARIASDVLDGGHLWISTVWLGLDHSFTESGPPLIFETMLFVRCTDEQLEERRAKWRMRNYDPGRFPWEDLETWRYATEEEAREGHRRVVDSLRMRIDLLDETGSQNG